MNFHCKLFAGEIKADLLLPTQENNANSAKEKNLTWAGTTSGAKAQPKKINEKKIEKYGKFSVPTEVVFHIP